MKIEQKAIRSHLDQKRIASLVLYTGSKAGDSAITWSGSERISFCVGNDIENTKVLYLRMCATYCSQEQIMSQLLSCVQSSQIIRSNSDGITFVIYPCFVLNNSLFSFKEKKKASCSSENMLFQNDCILFYNAWFHFRCYVAGRQLINPLKHSMYLFF